jgi:hypothetical protein
VRLEDPERYLAPSGRPLEIAVGVAVGLLATLFIYLALVVVVGGIRGGILSPPLLDRGKFAFMSVPVILLALGVPGAWIAYRLLTGRSRKDGGLMSPLLLRVGGMMLFVAPWFLLLAKPSDLWRWGHVVTMTSAGIACWILAARRERRDALEASVSVPTDKPIG